MSKFNLIVCFRMHLSLLFFLALFGGEVSSSERRKRGQPEFQQPLDNNHNPLPVSLENNFDIPSSNEQTYPTLLSDKTTKLLSEALHMLNRVKDADERRWVEAFIHRLGELAVTLQRSNNRNKEMKVRIVSPIMSQLHPSVASSSTTSPPKINKMPGKYQVTSAQMNDVLPVNERIMSRLVVTRPGVISKTVEDEDELVRQLHAQEHEGKGMVAQPENHVTFHIRPLDTTSTAVVTSPTTPVGHNSMRVASTKEKERKRLITNLLKELNELKKLGGAEDVEEVLIKNLKLDNHHFADFTSPNFIPAQKHDSTEEANEFEVEEDTQDDEQEDEKVLGELEKEDGLMASKTAPQSWKQAKETNKNLKFYPKHVLPVQQSAHSSSDQQISPHIDTQNILASNYGSSDTSLHNILGQQRHTHLSQQYLTRPYSEQQKSSSKNTLIPHFASQYNLAQNSFQNPQNKTPTEIIHPQLNPLDITSQNAHQQNPESPNNSSHNFLQPHQNHHTLEQILLPHYDYPNSASYADQHINNIPLLHNAVVNNAALQNPLAQRPYSLDYSPEHLVTEQKYLQAHSPDALQYPRLQEPYMQDRLPHLDTKQSSFTDIDSLPISSGNLIPDKNSTQHIVLQKPNHGYLTPQNRPNSDPQLNDDLERQLRAGKVVILSNSLVRTNFHSHPNKAHNNLAPAPTSVSISNSANSSSENQRHP